MTTYALEVFIIGRLELDNANVILVNCNSFDVDARDNGRGLWDKLDYQFEGLGSRGSIRQLAIIRAPPSIRVRYTS
jgi:hypothetical protein